MRTRSILAGGNAFGTSEVRGTGAASFVATGRHVGENADDHELAREWAKLRDREQLLAHPASRRFRAELSGRLRATGQLAVFRGLGFLGCHAPTRDEMGPPREGQPSRGRYSVRGTSVLYLCECDEGVRREVARRDGEKIYVQRFLLPLETLQLADLTTVAEPEFMNDSLFFAEVASDGPLPVHATFAFSQVVAEIVAEHFDGMIIPGVRGSAAFRYRNVVVFSPHPRWPSWLDQNWEPRLLD